MKKFKNLGLFFGVALITACSESGNYDASGVFEATTITVSAEQSGRITWLGCEEGDSVVAMRQIGGIDSVQQYLQRQLLEKQHASVSVSRPDIEKQTASYREQVSKLNLERRRIESLLKDGAAAQKQLDDIVAQIRLVQSQMNATQSSLSESNASLTEHASAIDVQKSQLDDQIRKCRIFSPISGVVLQKYAHAGEVTAAGQPLLKVADMGHVYLRAYFTSEKLKDVRLGQKMKVVADFGNGERKEYEGKVTWISPESEFTPKNVQTDDSRGNLVYAVKVAVRNDGSIKLGLYGECSVE